MRRDLACAAAGLAVAAAAWFAADTIPRSFLADAVGPGGVPKQLAVALALVSLWIGARALRRRAAPPRRAEPPAWRALGVAALGFAYLAAVPWLGYPAAAAALLGTAALYYGAPARPRLALFALAGAALLWLVFAQLLGVALPHGPF